MCFGDGTRHKLDIREKSRDDYRSTRYGPTHTYYPAHYYARPPIGPYMGGHQHHALQHRQHHHGHFPHNHRHSYALPSRHALVPGGINYGPHRYQAGGRAIMPSPTAMVSRTFLTFFRLSMDHTPPAPSSVKTLSWTSTESLDRSVRPLLPDRRLFPCLYLASLSVCPRLLFQAVPPPLTSVVPFPQPYRFSNQPHHDRTSSAPYTSRTMDNLGQPKPRHQYVLHPQPGRRGILVHSGQYQNGAPYVGSTGGMGMGMMGYGGMGMGMGYPGVNAHISPLYYGPNVSRSTYSNYAGFMGGYTGLSYGVSAYPSYHYSYPYVSPYASTLGYGCGMYANYYHPYQRTYYGMNPAMSGGAYSYSYPGSTTIIPPSTTTYTTVTNSAVPVPVATSTTTSTTRVRPHVHSPQMASASRDDVQYENRRVAMERGSYDPKPIKPASARPDDPFWCMERTGEWHLRTYYQIENECYPGRWLMDPEHGFLVFNRQ
jgi:hypothetical protein